MGDIQVEDRHKKKKSYRWGIDREILCALDN